MVRFIKSLCIIVILILLVVFVSYTEQDNIRTEKKIIATENNDTSDINQLKTQAEKKISRKEILLEIYGIGIDLISAYTSR